MRILIKNKLSEHKYKTPEGYLVCVDSPIARTGPQEYRVCDIDENSDDESPIEINRNSEDVFSPETIASFENKPLTNEHPTENVTPTNFRNYSVGFARDIHKGTFEGQDVILGTLIFTDEEAISDIESGRKTELSCGYDCDIVERNGKYYQTNIRGNHIALCEAGRAGIAKILDSETIQSGSKEALQKNIKTEIESGKDPKQVAAIAYATKRKNDVDTREESTKKLEKELPSYEEDAMKKYYITYKDLYLNQLFKDIEVKANSINEALRKLVNFGAYDIMVIKVQTDTDYYPRVFGRLSELRRQNFEDEKPEEIEVRDNEVIEGEEVKVKDEAIYAYLADPDTEREAIDKAKKLPLTIIKVGNLVSIQGKAEDLAKVLNVTINEILSSVGKPMSVIRKVKDNEVKVKDGNLAHSKLRVGQPVKFKKDGKMMNGKVEAFWYKGNPVKEDHFEQSNINHDLDHIVVLGEDGVKYRVNRYQLSDSKSLTPTKAIDTIKKIKKLNGNTTNDSRINDSKASEVVSEIKRTYPQVKMRITSKKVKDKLVTDIHFTNYPGEGASGFDNDPRTKLRDNWEKFLKYVYTKYVSKNFVTFFVNYNYISIVEENKKINDSRINDSVVAKMIPEIKRAYPQVKIKIKSKKDKDMISNNLDFSNYPGEEIDPKLSYNEQKRQKHEKEMWLKFLENLFKKYATNDVDEYSIWYDSLFVDEFI